MSVPMGGGYAQYPQIDFGWIGRAWELFKAQAGAWVVALLVYFLVAAALGALLALPLGVIGYYRALFHAVTSGAMQSDDFSPMGRFGQIGQLGHTMPFSLLFGALNFVLLGGLYRAALAHARGGVVSPAAAFSALDTAPSLIVVGLLTGLAVTVGSYLCYFPGLILGGLLMFAPLIVVDRRLGPIQALSESIALLKSQWLMAALFFLVIGLLAGVGALLCGVGMLVTYPLMFLSLAIGYLALTQPRATAMDYGQPAPGVWPPPPSGLPPNSPPGNWPPPSAQ